MDIKKRRKFNFLWGGITLAITVILIATLFSIKDKIKTDYIWDIIISWLGSFGIFWSFFITRFCFKNSKYKHVINYDANDKTSNLIMSFINSKFIWMIVIPIIMSSLIPLFYLVSIVIKQKVFIEYRTLIIISIIFISIINNISYLYTIKKCDDYYITMF